jgi:CDP-glycerol glycerophosphotransferase
MSRILDALLAALSFVLGIVVPRDPGLIAVGGRQFGGNTRPILEGAGRYGLRALWLTRRPEILALGRPDVVSTRSWRGLWVAARAGGVALTHSLGDFSPLRFPSRRTRLWNLWHGMPIKRISTADPAFHHRRHARSNLREMRRYAAMFVTSDAMADIFRRTFGMADERLPRTGQPRTDALLAAPAIDPEALFDPPLPPHRCRVLYCPTWREHEAVRLFPFPDRDDEALEAALERLDAVLFVRTHPNDPGRLASRGSRVVPLQGDLVPEITDALPLFEVLVTDYSSVYYDFLLLDRPVVFVPYDLEAYAAAPGFYLPFAEIAAGPCVSDQGAFLAALEAALAGRDGGAERRREVRALVYGGTADAGATDRVLAFIRDDLSRRAD